MIFITAAQIRAARAMLRWSAEELAERARVGVATVRRAEVQEGIPTLAPRTALAERQTFEMAGIGFIRASARGGPGVRVASAPRGVSWRNELRSK